jgi:hypothetical protein
VEVKVHREAALSSVKIQERLGGKYRGLLSFVWRCVVSIQIVPVEFGFVMINWFRKANTFYPN